jgi:cysteine desulfurase
MIACQRAEALGCEVTRVPVDSRGLVDPAEVQQSLRPNTRLISIMMANNETGVLQPLEEIGKIAAEADVYFHADAVQAPGKINIDVEKIGCDLLTISGHKIHGPQGIGALFVRKGTPLNPMLYGGTHERSRRAGTENVPGIVGLGTAADLAREGLINGSVERIAVMRDRLQAQLQQKVVASGVNGDGAARVPNTTNFYFDGVEGESLVIALDLKGLAVSTGAACSSGAIEPSHVLKAMGLPPERARASIRFSLGKQNRPEEVDLALELVPETLARLRELSPVWGKVAATR